jgi:exodeoxyribonuclease-1
VAASIYWYDFESFGVDPRRDRASQFAGIRTDEDLNEIGEPLSLYCQPADDFLPGPIACLITGITPQHAREQGVPEAEFIGRILDEFATPQTCVAGYNSIRFDDEMTRQLLYRNFYDPYEREWKNGNSRWDIIDMLRLCAAVRPEGINWPRKEDGSVSFKLEELTVANDIEHGQAHDALADVRATIAMARLVKQAQPKLFEHIYQLRNKRRVQAEIDLNTRKPFLHVSGMYPAAHGRLALVMPLCMHPTNSNGVVVYDLRQDPSAWIDLPADEIRRLVFSASDDLEEGESRLPIKTIHINRCPVVVSLSVLEEDKAAAYGIDLDDCRRHWQLLAQRKDLVPRIGAALKEERQGAEADPDFMIYSGGFFSDSDKSLMQTVRGTRAEDLGRLDLPFRDPRLQEMLFRYRARNFPDSLNESEKRRWDQFRSDRVLSEAVTRRYQDEFTEAMNRADQSQQAKLLELNSYVENLIKEIESASN